MFIIFSSLPVLPLQSNSRKRWVWWVCLERLKLSSYPSKSHEILAKTQRVETQSKSFSCRRLISSHQMTSVSVCFEVNNAAQLYANVNYFTDLSSSFTGGRNGGQEGMPLLLCTYKFVTCKLKKWFDGGFQNAFICELYFFNLIFFNKFRLHIFISHLESSSNW